MAVIGGQTLVVHVTANSVNNNRNKTSTPLPSPSFLRRILLLNNLLAPGADQGECDILIGADDDDTAGLTTGGTSIFSLEPNPTGGGAWASATELPLALMANAVLELFPGIAIAQADLRLKLRAARNIAGGTLDLVLVAEFDLVDTLPAGAGGAGIVPRVPPGPPAPPLPPPQPPPPTPPPPPPEATPQELSLRQLRAIDFLAEPLPEPCDIDPEYPLQAALAACAVK